MKDSTPRTRPFTISDGMILVAATSLGLAWSAQLWTYANRATRVDADFWVWLQDTVAAGLLAFLPTLCVWTGTIPILRIRKPRLRWRRISRQPGMTACLNGILCSLFIAPIFIFAVLRERPVTTLSWRDVLPGLLELTAVASPFVAGVILLSWVMLVVQRQWRCEASWIDRCGRAIGVAWIGIGAYCGAIQLVRIW